MSRRTHLTGSGRRHRGEPRPLGERVSTGVGRGAAVAVAAGLVLVALAGASALLRPADHDSGGRQVADGSSVAPRHGDPAAGGGTRPPAPRHSGRAHASPSVSSSAPPSATPTSSPTLPSPTLPSASLPSAPETSVPTPTKHHGKPPKADHTPGHGATHGPWKP